MSAVKSFEQRLIADRRLVLLRLLSEQRGRQANSSVLHMGLQHLGIVVERHEVIAYLRFLEHHTLVQLTPVTETVYVALLTGRGQDLVEGLLEVDGVSRPRRGI